LSQLAAAQQPRGTAPGWLNCAGYDILAASYDYWDVYDAQTDALIAVLDTTMHPRGGPDAFELPNQCDGFGGHFTCTDACAKLTMEGDAGGD
jgi:hypothetical protein